MRAELQGCRGQYSAGVAQTRGAACESEIQTLEAERSFCERTASDLHDVEAREQLRRTATRAPATGAVVGLSVFTPGRVVSPGQWLMDIVPERAALMIQARVAPDDVDDLAVGQRTLVRFWGLHGQTLPSLSGTITRLSSTASPTRRPARATILPR